MNIDITLALQQGYDDWFNSKKEDLKIFFPTLNEKDLYTILKNPYTEGALIASTWLAKQYQP